MTKSISDKLDHMSEFLSAQDLVFLGIYTSIDAAYLARKRSNSPAFIKLRHKILYPKKAVIEFLEDRLLPSGNTNNASHTPPVQADDREN